MLDKNLVWYVAGPMGGYPQCNIPLFDRAAAALRKQGFRIITPSELDSPAVRAESLASKDGHIKSTTWGAMLARDIAIVADEAGGIILLPYWIRSRGARLEVFTGLLCEKAFALYDPDLERAIEASRYNIRETIRLNLP